MFWNVFSHFSSVEITYNSMNIFDEVNPYGILFYEYRKDTFARRINSKESHIGFPLQAVTSLFIAQTDQREIKNLPYESIAPPIP